MKITFSWEKRIFFKTEGTQFQLDNTSEEKNRYISQTGIVAKNCWDWRMDDKKNEHIKNRCDRNVHRTTESGWEKKYNQIFFSSVLPIKIW